jgi:hypothetical protein
MGDLDTHIGLEPSRMHRGGKNLRILKMDPARHKIESCLGSAICGTLEWKILLVADAANCRGDGEELWLRGSIQQFGGSLKEEERPNDIDLEMLNHFLDGRDPCLSEVVGDTGIGNYDIELRDLMFRFECLNGGQCISLRNTVNLHKSDFAVFAMGKSKKRLGGSASWISDSCNEVVVGSGEVCGKKAVSNSCSVSYLART